MKTIKEKRDDLASLNFIGRVKEIKLFKKMLEGDFPEKSILYIHGLPGIGKTALLRELSNVVDKKKGVCFSFNFNSERTASFILQLTLLSNLNVL